MICSAGPSIPTSNISSLPEVGGNAAIYYDNIYNEHELAEKMEHVFKMNTEEKNERINLGIEQVKRFTWRDCAEKTLEILIV